jgi:hypothetical protein
MTAKAPRSVTVGLSVEQLEDAGIDDDEIDDYALAEIVEMVVKDGYTIDEAVTYWKENPA